MDNVIVLKPQAHYYISCTSYSMNITSILKGSCHISLIYHSMDIALVLKATNKPLGHFEKLKYAYHIRIKINMVVNTLILMITHKNYLRPKMQILISIRLYNINMLMLNAIEHSFTNFRCYIKDIK